MAQNDAKFRQSEGFAWENIQVAEALEGVVFGSQWNWPVFNHFDLVYFWMRCLCFGGKLFCLQIFRSVYDSYVKRHIGAFAWNFSLTLWSTNGIFDPLSRKLYVFKLLMPLWSESVNIWRKLVTSLLVLIVVVLTLTTWLPSCIFLVFELIVCFGKSISAKSVAFTISDCMSSFQTSVKEALLPHNWITIIHVQIPKYRTGPNYMCTII